jgi:hypothetical protein
VDKVHSSYYSSTRYVRIVANVSRGIDTLFIEFNIANCCYEEIGPTITTTWRAEKSI